MIRYRLRQTVTIVVFAAAIGVSGLTASSQSDDNELDVARHYALKVHLAQALQDQSRSEEQKAKQQAQENEAAVRAARLAVPEAMAIGAWSKPLTAKSGATLRGRLVLCEKRTPGMEEEPRETPLYVELQDISPARGHSIAIYCDMGRHDFRKENESGLICELRDKDGKTVTSGPFAFSGGVPKSEWLTLPSDGTIRVRATPYGLRRAHGLTVCPHLGARWIINEDDPNPYFLSGTFFIKPKEDAVPAGKEHVWRGAIELPAVRITGKR